MTSNEPPKAAQHLVGGRYSLAPDIRQGGMSVVQKAYDTQEHRFCAIKRMKGAQDDLRWKESFNREYAALCDLSSHPNIISLYEANFDESGFYMVLEWAPANLVDWIKQKGALSWDQFYAQIGRPLLEALAFAQGRGWSHRDIKPSNILLADNGVPKIADYGIAKQMEKPAIGLTFAQFRSVPFAPPEDDGGGELRSSRDCFSWAAVAIYCLTGKTPSDYGTLAELAAGLDRETTPIAILQATLSHTPEERPPLATALLTELNAFEADRLSKLPARQMCHLHLEPACIQGILRSLDVGDRGEIEVALLEELNDVRPGLKKLQTPEGKPRLRVFAVTWAFEMFRLDATRLSVRRAWQLKPSELEQYREGSFRPELIFTFNLPPNPELASEELDTLFLDLEAFEVDERQRALIARRERIFRVWYAFLRSKADFEARRENAITYVNAKLNGSILKLSTDLPAPAEVVGQSRVIRLASGGHIFCDIIDVNLDEVIVQVTSGDLGRLPQRGLLELNTLAAEKSIERQRSALDAINFDRAVSPRLKTIIVEPKSARPPIAVSAPKIGGGPLDLDKKEVLVRALGLQDILAIQGPPGTGKTRLIEEIIVQYLDRNPRNRVLVSSQTHVALDNVIERVRVRQPRIDIVRIGRLDDPKIGLPSRDLVLDRKAQAWAEQVRQRAHTFMTTWAQRKGIDRSAIELGMLAERLIRLLGQARALQDTLDAAKAQMRAADERAEQKLTDTGSAESPEIETAAVEAQDAAGATESALTKLKVAIQEVRDRLNLSGTYGAELAKQTDEGELKEWSTMLLGDSDDERTCRTLLELQEDWTLRVGRSSDFHAAMLVSAQIVAGTCIGIAGVRGMNQVSYDLCIVDEASKATATEILVPMSRSRKWILVGDPKQLPPFFEHQSITSIDDFEDNEVRKTLLDHFLGDLPDHSVTRLKNQYRMVKPIGDLVSEVFYDGALESPKIKPDVTLTGAFPKSVTWLSTTNLPEAREIRRGPSFRNEAECRAIRDALAQIDFIARKRKTVYDVAIIAGYVAQVKALQDIIRDRLHEWSGLHITCSTVDAFQGSESEICVYSVTRSNPEGKLGFLREKPRLNVALSRGRSALLIVGDDAFCRTAIGENPFRKVLDFIDAHPDECERRSSR